MIHAKKLACAALLALAAGAASAETVTMAREVPYAEGAEIQRKVREECAKLQGQLADYDTRILTLSVQKGFFGRLTDEPVSYVNAPAVAAEKGMAVHESKTSTAQDFVNLVTLRGGGRSMAGTLAGLSAKPRIVMVDDHAVDVPPADHMLVVRNDDSPGVIGFVGTVLGEAGVNIADMDVGQSPDGKAALMVLALSTEVPEAVQDQLRADARIQLVRSLG